MVIKDIGYVFRDKRGKCLNNNIFLGNFLI